MQAINFEEMSYEEKMRVCFGEYWNDPNRDSHGNFYDERLDGKHKEGDGYKYVNNCSNKPGAPHYRIVRVAPEERDTIGDTLTQEEFDVILFTQEGKCNGCGCILDGYNARKDHIKAYCLGGRLTFENTQLLCPVCNSKKWIHPPSEEMRLNIEKQKEIGRAILDGRY